MLQVFLYRAEPCFPVLSMEVENNQKNVDRMRYNTIITGSYELQKQTLRKNVVFGDIHFNQVEIWLSQFIAHGHCLCSYIGGF